MMDRHDILPNCDITKCTYDEDGYCIICGNYDSNMISPAHAEYRCYIKRQLRLAEIEFDNKDKIEVLERLLDEYNREYNLIRLEDESDRMFGHEI